MTPRRPASTRARPLALGYIRVSTVDQVDTGASLDAQRRALTAEAERRGWDVELVADEGLSAKNLNRPALTAALDRLDNGQADTLLSLRLDRVSRSVADFAGLMVRAQRRGWGLVLLSPALDLADPAGRFTANVLASAAEYERELTSARTREGMAQRKAEGVHVGRPSTLPAATLDRIRQLRSTGLSLAKTAAALTADGVPTAAGGQWHSSTIKAIEDREVTTHGR